MLESRQARIWLGSKQGISGPAERSAPGASGNLVRISGAFSADDSPPQKRPPEWYNAPVDYGDLPARLGDAERVTLAIAGENR